MSDEGRLHQVQFADVEEAMAFIAALSRALNAPRRPAEGKEESSIDVWSCRAPTQQSVDVYLSERALDIGVASFRAVPVERTIPRDDLPAECWQIIRAGEASAWGVDAVRRRLADHESIRSNRLAVPALSPPLLDPLLDSWDRNNIILLNFLNALPEGGLEARAIESSPSVAELYGHIHYVRLVFVLEDAPEFARAVPDKEWAVERDRERIALMLDDSALAVRDAVKGRIEAGRDMELHYDHPVLLLQHMLWHEGYHHGQMKLALKVAGLPMSNGVAGPLTWRVWMRKK